MLKTTHLKSRLLTFFLLIGLCTPNALYGQGLPDFTKLVEDNADAIVKVSIRTLPSESNSEEMQEMQEMLREFYGDRLPEMPNFRGRERASLGSGFIVSDDGYIVTNHHVVEGADEITITLNDQREYLAELIGSDENSDLAVLKIDETALSFVTMGDSSKLKVGEWVLAIGSPFGLGYSVAAGIISYMGRSLPTRGSANYVSYIQTDVAINPGHSGGPLFNLEGEVIGINSQIFSNSGGSIGLSFAIPADVAKNVVGQLRANGIVKRGWMGVAIADVSQELAEAFDLDTPRGALINQVITGGPADVAGFKSGDVIVSFNQSEIRTSADVPYQVGLTAPGSEVNIDVIRNGKMETLSLLVGDLSENVNLQLSGAGEPEENALGIMVSELSDEEKEERSLDSGVVVESVIGSVAIEAGLQVGDILLSLNNHALNSVDSFDDVVASLPVDRVLPVLVARGNSQAFFTIKLPNDDD